MAIDSFTAPPSDSSRGNTSDKVGSQIRRRTIVLSALGGLAALAGGYFSTLHPAVPSEIPAGDANERRILSLSPGVTDTIFSLNAGNELIAVSDYCRLPNDDRKLPQVGTALSPRLENVARLRPSLIVTSEVGGDALRPLEKLAPVLSLPWLTLDEWLSSIERLGTVLERASRAQALIARIRLQLSATPPLTAPRVLLALDYSDSGDLSTWFIRKNSIHGAVLAASGANNGVDRDIHGQPLLSPEQLLRTDPDGIIILRGSAPNPIREEQSKAHFQKWKPLRAVREGRIEVVSMEGALTVGPNVLKLLPLMKAAVARLSAPTAP